MRRLIVWSPGSKVLVGEIQAIIGAIRITGYPPRFDYEVIWWSGGDRKSAWVDEFEIEQRGEGVGDLSVGFK